MYLAIVGNTSTNIRKIVTIERNVYFLLRARRQYYRIFNNIILGCFRDLFPCFFQELVFWSKYWILVWPNAESSSRTDERVSH